MSEFLDELFTALWKLVPFFLIPIVTFVIVYLLAC